MKVKIEAKNKSLNRRKDVQKWLRACEKIINKSLAVAIYDVFGTLIS